MPVVHCPIEGCEYETPNVDPVVAAALITTHATVHASPHSAVPMAKANALVYRLLGQRRIGSTLYLDGVTT